MSQADDDIAATTLAVMWNGGGAAGVAPGRHFASDELAALLHEPMAALGTADPELTASLLTHAVMGHLTDLLWQRAQASPTQVERIVAFCVDAAAP